MTAADLPGLCGREGPDRPRGLYVHVPFCFHKCHYCDFYSIVDSRGREGAFVERLLEEIAASGPYLAECRIETVFVGGGTPTLLAPGLWERLLEALAGLPLLPLAEITVEANPETVTEELLAVLVAGGVNRLSIGAQSFDPAHLRTLDRRHDPANVRRSVCLARAAGLENLNLDLIFATPGQSLRSWEDDLSEALALRPDHLSCYALTYEPGTPLESRLRRGEVRRADEELEARMYLAAVERLGGEGFEHYEISNWTLPGRRCRHNLLYWSNASWWPLGPGAAGHVAGVRWKNAPRLGAYLETHGLPPVIDVEALDADGRVGETLMLGLRLVEGIPLAELEELLSRGRRGPRRRAAIAGAEAGGLLERAAGRLRLTRRGLLLTDSVVRDLL
jgi:oxygen-independent coproporphyrinogen-3 oxidase